MPVIINRSGKNLTIPEIRRVIPADGKRYVVSDNIFHRYRNFFEYVPVEIYDKVREQEHIINVLKKRTILFDSFNACGVNSKRIDVLYPFRFNNNLEEAVERLKVSIRSLSNQNVRICICNASTDCISEYLEEFDLVYIHSPFPRDEMYCKPKIINLGVKKMVSSEYFITSDVDLVYPPTFIDCISWFTLVKTPLRVVFNNHNLGYTNHIPQTYEECKYVFNNHKDCIRGEKFLAPGNGLIHLPSFKKIEGYDERFKGYGSEDSDFNYRISRINKYFNVDLDEVNSYHLWHEHSKEHDIDTDFVKENNNKKFRYVVYVGESRNMKIIKSGQIKFPSNLMEEDWSNKVKSPVEKIMTKGRV